MTGTELKNQRTKQGLTQQELGDVLGVSKQQVNRWENTGSISLVYQKILTNFFKK